MSSQKRQETVMKVERLVVGQLQTNCYLVWDGSGREAVVIDPGDDATLIVNRSRDLNLKPALIIATHGHFDHLLGVNELKWSWNVPLLMHEKDRFLLKNTRRSALHWTGQESGPPPEVERFIDQNDSVKFGRQKLRVIATPGHTPGGICLYHQAQSILFSGDTLFRKGVGRTDLQYASADELAGSLKVLSALPLKTVVYPGHGAATTIGAETLELSTILG